jgi:hypothetical protein
MHFAALRFGHAIDPQEHATGRQFALHAKFGEANVLVIALRRFRPKFRGVRRERREDGEQGAPRKQPTEKDVFRFSNRLSNGISNGGPPVRREIARTSLQLAIHGVSIASRFLLIS